MNPLVLALLIFLLVLGLLYFVILFFPFYPPSGIVTPPNATLIKQPVLNQSPVPEAVPPLNISKTCELLIDNKELGKLNLTCRMACNNMSYTNYTLANSTCYCCDKNDKIRIQKNKTTKRRIIPRPEINISQLEFRIHELVNYERFKEGLRALWWDERLVEIARKHSADMAKNAFFEHINLQGETATERGLKDGYNCSRIVNTTAVYTDNGKYLYISRVEGLGENLLLNNLYDYVEFINNVPVYYHWNTQEEIAITTVEGWMGSPEHRKNVLNGVYEREGIAIVTSADDKIYISENFC